MNEEIENTPNTEVAPQEVETQDEQVAPTDESATSPVEEVETENEKLILGKFKNQEDLEKSYLSLQGQYTKLTQAQKDPNYVYELAKQAGLTDEQAQEYTNQQMQTQQPLDINKVVDERLKTIRDYDKAIKALPELENDPALSAWAYALVDGGMGHEQAALYIKNKLGKTVETAKAEGAKQKEQEVNAKLGARTVQNTNAINSDGYSEQKLREQLHSSDPKSREKAYQEMIIKGLI